jgi:cytochrome c-type biogenesis protein CcmH/NrfG
MTDDRIEAMRRIVAQFPEDPKSRYFLAHELFKAQDWQGAAGEYDAYLRLAPSDEGVGWKNLGTCLARLGRESEARAAYQRGIQQATTFHHEGLATEIGDLLQDLEGGKPG